MTSVRLHRALPGIALVVLGVVVELFASDSDLGTFLGLAAIGVGAVWLVAVIFYEIGLSEDRAREREGRGRNGRDAG
jgi:hypothetical protein